MIDWVSAKLPFTHKRAISGGVVANLDDKGETVKSQFLRWRKCSGSFDSSIQVRTSLMEEAPNGDFSHLWISGNPVKLFQGHNVWGSNDLHGLLCETFEFLAESLVDLGGCPTDLDRQAVKLGAVHLSRVDLTDSFLLDNLGDCKAWIRAAEFSARMRHRGRGQMKEGTLYFGKNSERWATKIYAKGQEVRHHLKDQPALFGLKNVLDYADRCLRIEHVIKQKELARLGLHLSGNWDDTVAEELHRTLLQKLEFAEAVNIKPAILDDLPGSLQGAYSLWQEGHDLRQIYAPRTFYRYRKQLLAHGIDISITQEGKAKQDNVVPLVRVLEAVPAGVPDWAVGTSLYFEPRRFG